MNFFRNDIRESVVDSSRNDEAQVSNSERDRSIVGQPLESGNSPSANSPLTIGALDAGLNPEIRDRHFAAQASVDSFTVSNSEGIILSLDNLRSFRVKAAALGNGLATNAYSGCGCGQCAQCNSSGSGHTFADYNDSAFDFSAISSTLVDLDQVVFLDFDTNADPNPFFDEGPLTYTEDMRMDLMNQLNEIYRNFGVTFVTEEPVEGDFSTVLFRTTVTTPDGTPTGSTGQASEGIDFLNRMRNDTVIMNILIGSGLTVNSSPAAIVEAARNVAAHEVAHALGLRHHDSFGPIGTGAPFFSFVFPGPADAIETPNHVINTPVFGGDPDFFGPRFFGARESAKLTFAAIGEVANETADPNDSFGTAQPIELALLTAPNALEFGRDANSGDFVLETATIEGSFTSFDPIDFYSFQGLAGRAYSFEVISTVNPRFTNIFQDVDTTLAIYDSSFQLVDYFGQGAFNDDDLEGSFDPHIFDLVLPEDGTYFIEVDTFFNGDTGGYELFVQSLEVAPFVLDQADDFTDTLDFALSESLEFEDNSNNFIARENGVIGFEGTQQEQDVFSFTIDTASRVIVDARTTSNFFDTFLEVFDADNRRVAFNDNSVNPSFENPNDSQLIISNLPAGDYYAVVSGVDSTIGQYRLGVRHNGAIGEFDDHGDSLLTSTSVELNPLPSTTFINASAELGTDSDTFAFTSEVTGRVVVRSLATSGDLNTVLRGFNSDRQLVVANNNFNGTLDSRISLEVLAGETYFLRLSTVRDTAGDYRLSLRTIESENNMAPGGDGDPLSLGGNVYDPNIQLSLDQNPTFKSVESPAGIADLGRVDQYDDFQGFLA